MFHFKKFSIEDNKSAMKIGTDAVLLGSWTPCMNESRILDIGTGSGILALMMAQRNTNTPVDAIEIEPDAASLASQNVELSPWSEQINILNTSLQEYSLLTKFKYSLIICNPPFFTNSLKTPESSRNLARHNDTLPVDILLKKTAYLLSEEGNAAFIFPYIDSEKWMNEAKKNGLYPSKVTLVKSSDIHEPHRVLVVFSRINTAKLNESEICIYSSRNNYSNEYRILTRDFYLKF